MKTGIYFNTTFEQYKAIPALSRSLAEDILFDLEEARHKLTTPQKTTPAMELGVAIHSILLEPKTFNDQYIMQPTPSDKQFAGKRILFTTEDLKPFLEKFGLKKSGQKQELIASLREYLDPKEFVFWDDVKESFEREVELFDKKILTQDQAEIVFGLRDKMNKTEEIKQVFSGGHPEVTLVWKDAETGILCKCRLDYLRPDAIGELKSFSVKNKKQPLFKLMCREIENNRYNFQFSVYLNALEQLISEIKQGKSQIFGDVSEDFKNQLLSTEEKRSFIVFARTAAPFQMRAFEIEKRSASVGSENCYYSVANDLWRAAVNKYAQALKSGVWKEQEITMLEDYHVQAVMFQNSEL